MAYHLTQEKMEETVRSELAVRGEKGGEICSMLVLEFAGCDAAKGELTLRNTAPASGANPAGNLHGGIITWLMDSAMGLLSRGYTGYERTVTMDIHVNFLRPVHIGDEIMITGRITHCGRQIINVCSEAVVDDRICATADGIFYRIS